jgi:type I restriction enzyme S subunit
MARETSSTIFKDLVNSPVGIIAEYIVNRLAMKSGYTPLKEFISEIQTGKTPPMNNPEYYSSNDMEWIKPSDIGFEKYITATDWISNIAVKANKATIYKPNTILIICIGGGIGRLGIVNKLCSSNQQITGVLFKDNVIPEYAYYFFLSRYKIFEANSSKSTLPIINQKGLGNLDFLCPKVDVQKEIVKYLDYCKDCLIGNFYPTNEKFNLESEILNFAIRAYKAYYTQKDLLFEYQNQLTQLENLNQAILQEAVQGKLVKQGPKDLPDRQAGEPASELLKRIKAEKAKSGKKEKSLPPIKPEEIPFEIPENWVWCRLGEVIEYTDNLDIQKHLSPDTIINYVDIDAIDNQNFVIREAKQKTVRGLSTRARRVLKPNFIAYSTVRPYLKNIAVIEEELENYIGSTGFNVFKTLNVELKYAFYYLLTPYVNNSFKDLMVGFNSPSITNDQFEKSLFPLPPESEQKRIVTEIEKQLAKTKLLKEHIIANQQATEQLLKALLHQAFLPVPQAGEVEEMVTV